MSSHSQQREPTAIGIDVGGTKIALGIITADGHVASAQRIENNSAPDFAALLGRVTATVAELRATIGADPDQPAGIGVATCELVNREGEICSATSVPWTRDDLLEALSPFGPVTLEADVRASALAEARLGAGAPYTSFIHVTVGTGISCCLVRSGIPDAGAHGFAQLIGSAPLTIILDEIDARSTVTLEDIAAGPSLVRRYNARARTHVAAAEDVVARAAAGDITATAIVEEAATVLGSYIALLINILDPEAVIVGGGLSFATGPFWETLVSSTRDHIWSDRVRRLPITRAQLGPNAALVGAGLLALARKAA